MSRDVEVEKPILYDLSVNSEWNQDPETVVCNIFDIDVSSNCYCVTAYRSLHLCIFAISLSDKMGFSMSSLFKDKQSTHLQYISPIN